MWFYLCVLQTDQDSCKICLWLREWASKTWPHYPAVKYMQRHLTLQVMVFAKGTFTPELFVCLWCSICLENRDIGRNLDSHIQTKFYSFKKNTSSAHPQFSRATGSPEAHILTLDLSQRSHNAVHYVFLQCTSSVWTPVSSAAKWNRAEQMQPSVCPSGLDREGGGVQQANKDWGWTVCIWAAQLYLIPQLNSCKCRDSD